MGIGPLESEAGEVVMEYGGGTETVLCIHLYSGRHEQHTRTSRESGAKVSILTITKEKVLGKLKGLKVDKLPGPDGPYTRVLKEIAEEIVEALEVIFQESLESGRVPDGWNMAN
eukprot:g25166.t1